MPAPAMAKTTSGPRPWSRSETLCLANEQCSLCHGIGLRLGRAALSPCNCVLRAIFRICYNRYREIAEKEKYLSRPTLEVSSQKRRTLWGRRDEEYLADFYLVSKRNLTAPEWDLFRFYFLLDVDWKLCAEKLKLDRGNFFHAVYRIEQRLGRIFRDLEPFPLFPLDEYFSPARAIVQPTPPPRRPVPVRLSHRKNETLDS